MFSTQKRLLYCILPACFTLFIGARPAKTKAKKTTSAATLSEKSPQTRLPHVTFTETYLEHKGQPSLYTIFMPAKTPVTVQGKTADKKNATHHNNAPTILWFHGLSKHCRRYMEAMEFMAQNGFNSIGFDIRGHGRSGGIRGYINSFDDCLTDLTRTYNHYAPQIKGKLFLVGHSMGGLIMIRHLQKQGDSIPADACIATVPCVAPHKNILPEYKQKIVKMLAKIKPTLMLSVDEEEHQYIHTEDETMKSADKDDPYIIRSITAQGLARTLPEIARVMPDVTKIKKPFHILASGKDNVVDTEKTREFYAQLPSDLDKSITVYDSMNHSILHETDRHHAFAKLLDILNAHVQPTPPAATASSYTLVPRWVKNGWNRMTGTVSNWLHRKP